jgi:aminopeptidase
MENYHILKKVFKNSLNLKKYESCLIIADTITEQFAKEWYYCAVLMCKKADFLLIKPTGRNGKEPAKKVSEIMKKYDLIIIITKFSMTHTKSRQNACKNGSRVASMPGITKEMINRCLDIDYKKLRKDCNNISKKISKSKLVKIVTKKGTDLIIEIPKDRPIKTDDGILDKKGTCTNLPAGEVYFAPKNANGKIVIDASMAGIGVLKSPLTLEIKNNFVIKISGRSLKKLKSILNPLGKKAYMVAELGIGLNKKAKVTGIVLEDEKVLGTIHLALGNNASMGGKNKVAIHLDGVVKEPSLYIDDKMFHN